MGSCTGSSGKLISLVEDMFPGRKTGMKKNRNSSRKRFGWEEWGKLGLWIFVGFYCLLVCGFGISCKAPEDFLLAGGRASGRSFKAAGFWCNSYFYNLQETCISLNLICFLCKLIYIFFEKFRKPCFWLLPLRLVLPL